MSVVLLSVAGCTENTKIEKSESGKDWPIYLGGNSSNQYSSLTEMKPQNVHLLEPVWEYRSENGNPGKQTQIQCNPIIVDGVLYATSPNLKVFALDAASGKQIWEFDTTTEKDYASNVNRGVTFWADGGESYVLFTSGPFLYSLDAKTGKLNTSFGDQGRTSLKKGLGTDADQKYVVGTSPGIVYKDLIIMGSRVSENADAAPGSIRAYNARTGNLQWLFHTIPHPGEFGYDTWPKEAWKTVGGANSWAGMSLDLERGIVFVPTGSPAFDFWGGNRKGQNLFANCVLALDAATGKRIWHYQTVLHDLWDRDLPAPPNLVSVTHKGKKIDAVAQITKSGLVFLLDRETGEPLFPVEERKVPKSDLKGEEAWPTQPFPLKPPPFSPQSLTKQNFMYSGPDSTAYTIDTVKSLRTGQAFIPPSKEGTVIFPGFDGGGEWGGAAVDIESSVLYVNGSIMPWILSMVETDVIEETTEAIGATSYKINCAVCHGQNREGKQASNYPALDNIHRKFSKTEILEIMDTGKGFMPSFLHLGEAEKELIAAFLLNEDPETDEHLRGIASNEKLIPYTHRGYNRFLDANGYPAVRPPWGNLSAIDLNQGEILWQVPLGEYAELNEKGMPKTGTENYGGPVVTAGGLLFIAASKDEYFRAFDRVSGEELWKYKLPAGGYATPSVYGVNGRQYVVIACGGGKMGTKSGDSYIAFALVKE